MDLFLDSNHPYLDEVLTYMYHDARERAHMVVTVEHLLHALLEDATCSRAIFELEGSADLLQDDLVDFFTTLPVYTPTVFDAAEPEPDPVLAPSLKEILTRGLMLAKLGGTQTLPIHVLAAIAMEPSKMPAAEMLRKQQVSPEPLAPLVADAEEASKRQAYIAPPFTIDLVAEAQEGRLHPVVGRREEIRRMCQILLRHTGNNPVLVGDAGVGKTAIVEGLAVMIAQQDVPEALKPCRIYALDLASLVAGTKFRGEFEARLKAVVAGIQRIPNARLFVDEIHMLVGAGRSDGGMDASNILKPELSRGKISCIGATTQEEWRQHIERDRALARRFQKIQTNEPSVSDAKIIVRDSAARYEHHHEVRISHAALDAAVAYTVRAFPDRHLPDKAFSILDDACAFVRLNRPNAPQVEEADIIAQVERTLGRTLPAMPDMARLEDRLNDAVQGQQAAVAMVAKRIKRAYMGLRGPDTPMGRFLFTGPTGVGKTELALALGQLLQMPVQRFDMSEYQERHTVARLIGAPPGYVGFDQGSLLIDGNRRHPASILLFDEIDKAHPDVEKILLQILDTATICDSQNRRADFRQAIIIMTSNTGATEANQSPIGFGAQPNRANAMMEAVKGRFVAELRERLDGIALFERLSSDVAERLTERHVQTMQAGLLATRKVSLQVSKSAIALLAQSGISLHRGARDLQRQVEEKLGDVLFDPLCTEAAGPNTTLVVDVVNNALHVSVGRRVHRAKMRRHIQAPAMAV